MLHRIRGRRWEVASFAILTITTGIFILLASLSWFYARAFTHMPCAGDYTWLEEPGVQPETVEFLNPDGILIHGWLALGGEHRENGIIVLPGATGNTQLALPDALVLMRAGYSTLVFEHRTCANPASMHSGGYLEAEDLVRAAKFLKARPEIQRVGVLGFSTGGSTALLAAARTSDIDAVVAMGGFSSLADDVLEPEIERVWIDRTVRTLILFLIGYQLGIDPDLVSPVDQVDRISPRPILLIYGEGERRPGETLFEAAGDPKEMWIVPNAGHGGYAAADPEEYRSRVLTFFQRSFGQE
ncbi:MAG TPA: prolyl oligopeptidase family serine peptidase [Anaerolineales bacterium]|nr:prolyl oligopeptidase family serine peptidase [Anaerolineales bacterium]